MHEALDFAVRNGEIAARVANALREPEWDADVVSCAFTVAVFSLRAKVAGERHVAGAQYAARDTGHPMLHQPLLGAY